MEQFIDQVPQTILNGLTLGSVYALIALGYSMVYGILKLLNFAHGDVYMVGAYVGYAVFIILIPPDAAPLLPIALIIVLMIVFSTMLTGLLGIAIERFAYRPLRNATRIAPLISALGVSFMLQNLVQLTVSPRPLSYGSGTLIALDSGVTLGSTFVTTTRILVIGMTFVLMLILTYFVRGTRIGRAMRAVAMDIETAEMMGVNVNQVIVTTFLVGSILAAVGGVLVGIVFLTIRHTMGFIAGLKGFTASVVGGIGSLPGAVVGGLLLGLVESFATVLISPTFKDAYAFIILVIVLIIRPTGILGRPLQQKV